jgi:RsiW-degrading membrane proteinase PrsW (M82 family)
MDIPSFFANPSIAGIGLAVVFTALWLIPFMPLRLKSIYTWLVFIGGAIVFAPSIALVQVPLQSLAANWEVGLAGTDGYIRQLWILSLPMVLLSGLVQEAFKLAPTAFYWWRSGKNISPKLGLTLGAMAGAGFAFIETQWVLNLIFSSGFNINMVNTYGFAALAGFWERFFTTCFHISVGALAGWGLAKGRGWQFYLMAAGIHALINYGAILVQIRVLTAIQTEIYITLIGLAVFGLVMWLRWRKDEAADEEGDEPLDDFDDR